MLLPRFHLLAGQSAEGQGVKVVFVLSQSLDSPSGLGRFGPLARELVRMGHEVALLALHHDWARLRTRTYIDTGVRVAYVAQMHVRKEGSLKTYYSPGRLLAVSLVSTLRLAYALGRTEGDVIQLCKPQPINALAVQLGRRGRPIYCDCDDYEAATNRFGGAWQRAIVRHFENGIVDYALGLTVNTRFTQQRYRRLGFPAERVAYVPNGVERTRFASVPSPSQARQRLGFQPECPLVVYVGTLSTHSHCVDLLLRAFARVKKHLPAARLLLVGGGEDFEGLRLLSAHLGILDSTIFAGWVPAEAVLPYYAAASVCVDPVKDDAIARARSPLKIVESLAVGVPVVTGDVGDRREMLADGALGILVTPGDDAALAQGLLQALQSAGLRHRMRQQALAQRERWYWDRLAEEFVRVYGDPARRGGTP